MVPALPCSVVMATSRLGDEAALTDASVITAVFTTDLKFELLMGKDRISARSIV